jgi:hypothetical protein
VAQAVIGGGWGKVLSKPTNPQDKTSLNFEFINHLSLCNFISWMEA